MERVNCLWSTTVQILICQPTDSVLLDHKGLNIHPEFKKYKQNKLHFHKLMMK